MGERHYTNKLGWEETARASLGVMLAFLVGWLLTILPSLKGGDSSVVAFRVPVSQRIAQAERLGYRRKVRTVADFTVVNQPHIRPSLTSSPQALTSRVPHGRSEDTPKIAMRRRGREMKSRLTTTRYPSSHSKYEVCRAF